ncbi:hydrogen peroxide-dependent heme synthase [Leucobacter sp. gxy201]|uniref:hydrogen peroxide-dependent heme synthase n=1 Tax=Leucobacter sp. gxy201 TaxID=2957200 RepID=UPI003DA11C0F
MTEPAHASALHDISPQVAEQINAAVNFTMYSVFRIAGPDRGIGVSPARHEIVRGLVRELDAIEGLTTRGWYDVAGFRADADILIWWHAPTTEALQAAYRTVLEWSCGRLESVWSNIGAHRAGEFNRSHIPAFLVGTDPKDYICVYPFVRGREWYLLPESERGAMLREHGAAARDFGDVQANTVAAFALGDYEWLLAFEADDLIRIVDLMRELRAVDARRHVIEETPFFTGPRCSPEELLARVVG